MESTATLFKNANLLDPRWEEARDGYQVMVADGEIKEVSDQAINPGGADIIDCRGRTLMPGLIDCHVHIFLSEVRIGALESVPLTLMTARAAPVLRAMLDRGFTTVRDTGGADWGIREGLTLGYLPGPRLFISGRAIGPTSGHVDFRRRTDRSHGECPCCHAMRFTSCVVDGADAVRAAVREELRQGADAIKLVVSGGVASPHDPLDSRQFTVAEIAAAVEEAAGFGRYVLAHAYTPEAITRAVSQGVRTIEHGNLIDDASAQVLAASGGYLVANLVAYMAIQERGARYGMTADGLAKNERVLKAGFESLDICDRAGVRIGFGSDLLGELQNEQSREFQLRSQVQSPIEIIRSATLIGAEIVRMEGLLGVVEPGAIADLLVVDGNPLDNLELLQGQGRHLSAIMQEGKFHKLQTS